MHLNFRSIFLKERQLGELIDSELKENIAAKKVLERINNEKVTPYFLKIVNSCKDDTTMHEIKKEDGSVFESDSAREEFITSYYANVYQKDTNLRAVDANTIPNFLAGMVGNPVVNEARLTEEEKNSLEGPITFDELDKSLKQANLASAPGIDGISNKFIRQFWTFFRTPLKNYSNHCFATGQLTDSFRSAKIKLIPKKGDPSKIKNWRPISLINCFYKIISRALSNRLGKYIDKLTPVGQKGYSKTRQCQEVLISITECLQRQNFLGRKGAILSLDIGKAFDSLSHSFLSETLKFYNIGPSYRKWIELIATNRFACIILGVNKLGKNFLLCCVSVSALPEFACLEFNCLCGECAP